ncbi:MAG TPA: amino acid ABC transporter substrate-binding protein, partial [Aquabacterium sp.]|nr:amino acid ABC transporter substrate-binding protein [Aquabacterium sp.]
MRALVGLLLCAFGLLAQAQESPTLRKIRETGVVSLGYRVAAVPFSYLDARRRPIGYSIDICERVVDAIRQKLALPGLEARLVMVSSATRLPMVANGTVDLECGVTTNTAERQKSVAFSITTFVAASRLLSRSADNIRSVADLRGRAVTTTVSTTSMQYLTAANQARSLEMKILAGADDADAFQMVRTGRAAAFAMDDVLLRGT